MNLQNIVRPTTSKNEASSAGWPGIASFPSQFLLSQFPVVRDTASSRSAINAPNGPSLAKCTLFASKLSWNKIANMTARTVTAVSQLILNDFEFVSSGIIPVNRPARYRENRAVQLQTLVMPGAFQLNLF